MSRFLIFVGSPAFDDRDKSNHCRRSLNANLQRHGCHDNTDPGGSAAPKFTRRGGGDVSFSAEAALIFSIEQETARSTFASALEVERLLAKAFGR